jgi:hypothetical protein
MSSGKELVFTAYGHGNVIDKIAVSSFDSSSDNSWYSNDSDARTYCKTLNVLKLTGGSWLHAKIIPENTPFTLSHFLPLGFSDVILKITDRALQDAVREIDKEELAVALKGCGEAVFDKISRNMSSNAFQMLKDLMESHKTLLEKETTASRDKIIAHLQYLESEAGNYICYSKEKDK